MKKAAAFLLCLAMLLPLCAVRSAGLSADALSAECAVLMCAETGQLLLEKHAHRRHAMASTTKIMTSLLALEQQTPRRVIRVREAMLRVEGTSMGLQAGDSVTLETLVYGMLLQSGNDAANVTAIAIDGSLPRFAARMNARAAQLGMRHTHFVTPSGLDDEEHYSTAYDMALLGCCAVRNPAFLHICRQRQATVSYGSPPYARTLTNHNRLLASYDGACGIKTGFTKKSGRCLVSCASREGVTLVAVTLGAPDDWSDHRRMLDYGFDAVERQVVPETRFAVPVVGSAEETLPASCASVTVCAAGAVKTVLLPAFVYAPVKAGDVLGEVRYTAGGRQIASVPITAQRGIAADLRPEQPSPRRSLLQRLAEKCKEITIWRRN